MKKLLSLFLAIAMIFTSSLTIIVSAADTVEVTNSAFSFDVEVTTEAKERINLTVYSLTEQADGTFTQGTTPIYVGQINTPVADTEYTYTGSFAFKRTTQSGYYRLVTNRGNQDFYFVNPTEKIALYKGIKAADHAGIEAKLSSGVANGVVDFDYGDYFTYSGSNIMTLINKGINALDTALPADIDESTATSAEIDAYIKSFESVFLAEFKRLLTVANLMSTTDKAVFEENIEALGLDTTYINDATIIIPSDAILTCLKALILSSYSMQDVENAFDTAVLLAGIKNIQSPGYVTVLLEYYDDDRNSRCITLDKTYTKDYDEDAKNALSAKLQGVKDALLTAADIEHYYKELSEPSTTGGGGGGGSGTSSGRPSPTRPAPPVSEEKPDDTNPPENTEFTDLGEAEWAQEAIAYLVDKGVLEGMGDGKFYPDNQVTREQFMKMIIEAFDLLDEKAKSEFYDVSKDRWSYAYIASGYTAGIINGTSDTEFTPNGGITRQDMAVIIYRVAQYLGYELPEDGIEFDDSDAAASYAKEAISILAAAGIINGTGNNNYAPDGIVTRAQAAKIVYELLIAMGGTK